MPEDDKEDVEREFADDLIAKEGRDKLIEYVINAPSSAWEVVVNCSDEHLIRLLDASIAMMRTEDCGSASEVLGALLSGFIFRFQNGRPPDEFVDAVVAYVKNGGKLG